MPQIKNIIFMLLFLNIFLCCTGCSDKNKSITNNTATGNHFENWIIAHRAAYLSNREKCTECHGSDYKGGISNVSCSSASVDDVTCHPNGPFEHPEGWADAASHGTAAKASPDSTHGFLYCQGCHGEDYSGGPIKISCFTCHGSNSPHPAKPWNEDVIRHRNTKKDNLSICLDCHTNGNNSEVKPTIVPADSTALGCFNGTICHDPH